MIDDPLYVKFKAVFDAAVSDPSQSNARMAIALWLESAEIQGQRESRCLRPWRNSFLLFLIGEIERINPLVVPDVDQFATTVERRASAEQPLAPEALDDWVMVASSLRPRMLLSWVRSGGLEGRSHLLTHDAAKEVDRIYAIRDVDNVD